MKIGINALFFQFPATGCGQYLFHLLDALAAIDQQNEYVLLGSQPVAHEAQDRFPYQVHPVPGFAARNKQLEKLAWEQFTAPHAAHKAGVDLFHIPYFAPPLFARMPTVVTIHDVIPLLLPAYRLSGKMRMYMSLVARTAHRAKMIITVSQHAKQDIINTLKIPAERICVIYEAAGEQYYPITDQQTLAAARAKYGIGERYIFYLGGLDQRKNVPQLVHAFADLFTQIGDPALQLVISGNPDKQQGPLFPDPRPVAEEKGISKQVICRFIEEEDKAALYSAAELFVFPSLYEGFGLPPLEAMACGAPVVCANRTSLPEVVGEAAITVDPEDTQAMASAMGQILSNQTLRDDLCARSLRQAAQFSWRKTAQETLAVYQEIVSG